MSMNQYHSIFIAHDILAFPETVWTVHSLFDNVINLSCADKPNLLSITHVSQPLLPYGIHLMPYDFNRVKQQFNVGDDLLFTSYFLQHHRSQINLQGQYYHSQLVVPQVVQSHNIALLVNCLKLLNVRNGFGQTFQESLLDDTHLIKQLVVAQDKSIPLKQLIGRGIGLTPSGDDMVVGYNLAASCQGISVVQGDFSQTTVISQHYLYCSSQHRFHATLLALIKLLTQSSLTLIQLQSCVEAILSFGHTSGCDTLTGFILSILYMRGEL